MRLIGTVENEAKAFAFYAYLREMGIHATYEPAQDGQFAMWIHEEDETERALEMLKEFKANPDDPKYKVDPPANPPIPPDDLVRNQEDGQPTAPPPPKKPKRYPLTTLIIMLCALLYFWNTMQQVGIFRRGGIVAAQYEWTNVQKQFLFDYPKANQDLNALLPKIDTQNAKTINDLPEKEKQQIQSILSVPTWKGFLPIILNKLKGKDNPSLYGPMFTSISKGEIYRLFTPCLLHGSLLHILFNMAWVWILMRQIEERLSKLKLILFVLIVGIIANVAQYFVSGPYFLGFSGVVVGMVGFIWVKQKKAPWEGYPLQKSAIWFVAIYVLVMFGLELFSLFRALGAPTNATLQIANTAHIVGGITGAILARVPLFSRGFQK